MPVHILAAARTPFGAFGGSLKGVPLVDLGACALRETLVRSHLDPQRLDGVILGCALPAGGGENPARQAALTAGLPRSARAYSPNLGSASGLKALILGAQELQLGLGSFILAGGADNLSRTPYYLPEARWGVRMGEADLLDSLVQDLPSQVADAESLARTHGISLQTRQAWVDRSLARARESRTARQTELVPFEGVGRRGPWILPEDEAPAVSRIPLVPHLAPPADGAAAVLLGPASHQALGEILGWAESGLGCCAAVCEVLASCNLSIGAVDLWEIHESTSAHALALLTEMPGLDLERVNVQGGALALGDAASASGVRLVLSLLRILQERELRTGVAVISAGGDLGLAMAIRRN